jgi:hypothetical protein
MTRPLEVDGNAPGIPGTPVIESALAWPTLYPFPIPRGIHTPTKCLGATFSPNFHLYPLILVDRLIALASFTIWTSLPLIAVTPVQYTVLYSTRRGLLRFIYSKYQLGCT